MVRFSPFWVNGIYANAVVRKGRSKGTLARLGAALLLRPYKNSALSVSLW